MLLAESKKILKKLDDLPTLPNLAKALLQMASQETVQVEEITSLIEADPATSARLLRIVNSPYLGMQGRVTSVSRAVVMLGFNGVRNALLSVQIFSIFGEASRAENSELFELWKHSLAVASAAELVAENTGGLLPEDAFTAGLLHDIGKIALYTIAPGDYKKVFDLVSTGDVPVSDAEERIFEMTHAAAGRFLAEKWGLPPAVSQAIYQHHSYVRLEHREDPIELTAAIVSVADDVVRRQRIGFSGTPESWEPLNEVFGRIGLEDRNVDDILSHLVERMSMRSTILDLDIPESTIYLECLRKANTLLGKFNGKLDEIRITGDQARKRLEAITDLHARLGSSFDTSDVLAGIADKIHQHLLARKVIAYCVDDKGHSVSGSVKNGTGETKPFFLSLLKGAHNEVASLGHDREALKYLVDELAGRLADVTGPGDLIGGRLAYYPISVGRGQRAGILIEASDPVALDPAELKFFAEAASTIFERALLEERLRTESERLVDSNRRSKSFYEELINARKLAAIGRMAAGAAHEINNPLAIISGRIQLLLKMEADEGKKRHLDMVRNQCDRMSRIISDILTFSRPEKPALKPTDVREVIDSAASLVEPAAAAKNVAIVKRFADNLPQALGDAPKLEQVFRNILDNAVDASEKKSEVTITADVGEKGKFLAIGFADNGTGMDEETLGRIFEPFFTKKEGRGTGLGLAICHSIIQTHGGKIRVKSAPGKGTTFTVLLPVEKAT